MASSDADELPAIFEKTLHDVADLHVASIDFHIAIANAQ